MSNLIQLIHNLGQAKILLIGDLILDHFVNGEVSRISPEAPIPVLEVTHEKFELGGVGNVAANVAALGGKATCVAMVGDDPYGKILRERLAEREISDAGLVVDNKRPTILKTRHTSRVHQILRVDREDRTPLTGKLLESLLQRLPKLVDKADLIILSDYEKGVLTPKLLQAVFQLAKKQKKKVLIDPKGKEFSKYRGATILTPNKAEAEAATGITIETKQDLHNVGKKLIQDAQVEAILITLGKDGAFFLTKSGEEMLIPTEARAVFDVTGAGDTVISSLGMFLASGASLEEAVRLANIAGGIVVGKFGTATVSREELLSHLDSYSVGGEKILQEGELDVLIATLRREGKRIVFTNGCFDLLHAGHVRYLQQARDYGDCLFVGVNDDPSVRRLKGEDRPIQPLEDRLQILAGLQSVSYVIPFHEDTPLKLIQKITPDVLVKGEDWKNKGVVGGQWVEDHGGLVILAKLATGRSTSEIIGRIKKVKKHAKTR